MSKARTLINLARHSSRADRLQKSGPAAQVARLTVDPKRPRPTKQVYAKPGGFVRVHRPGVHEQPTLARLLSVGNHGITVADDQGRPLRVRHEHVTEGHAAPSGRERAAFAAALNAQGIPVPLPERFLQLNHAGHAPRRATRSQLELMSALTAHGVPYDLGAIQEGATFEDAEQLLGMYITDPDGKIGEV